MVKGDVKIIANIAFIAIKYTSEAEWSLGIPSGETV
jgi:hypothetical protein